MVSLSPLPPPMYVSYVVIHLVPNHASTIFNNLLMGRLCKKYLMEFLVSLVQPEL